MRAYVRCLMLAALTIPVGLWAADPAIGTWKLNVAKSKYDPGPAPKSATVTYAAHGDGVTRSGESVAADGATTNMSFTASFDGKDYPVTGSPTYDAISLKRIDENTAEATLKKGGKVVSTARRVVAKDGKTLTLTITGTNADGKPMKNVAVYERQ